MASVLGAGSAFFRSPVLDAYERSAPRDEEPWPPAGPVASVAAVVPEGTDEERRLLTRAASALATKSGGLTLPELRVVLGESSNALPRALAVGLRTKQLRRSGSRNEVHYLVNR